MGTQVERRDRTQVKLTILYELGTSGGSLPIYTKNGIKFKLALYEHTMRKALKDLQDAGLIKQCKLTSPSGDVKGVQLTPYGQAAIAAALGLCKQIVY